MRLLDELFRSQAVEHVLADDSLLLRMLQVEAALASAEAEVGLIPPEAAQQIESCCESESLDRKSLSEGAKASGNLAIPLVKQLTRAVEANDPEAAKFVHWGATSQDIIDTAVVLQTREALSLILAYSWRANSALRDLTEQHRNTIMPGRTWMQHALPITFGLKTANWLSALHRASMRLAQVQQEISVLQFGGAAGTLAALGNNGARVAEKMAARLRLAVPPTPWHSDRERIAEVATALGILCATMGKVAHDIALMTQTEVGELSEPHAEGRGGSSTMPQKQNPVFCAAILANVTRVPGLVSTVLAAMIQEHERGLGGWHAEWETIPEILGLTGGAAERIAQLLSGIEIHANRMLANIEISNGLIFAEAVSTALSKKIGKSDAHSIVEAAATQVRERGKHLSEVLKATPEVSEHLSATEIAELFDPQKYLGSTQTFIDRVLAECAEPAEVSRAVR